MVGDGRLINATGDGDEHRRHVRLNHVGLVLQNSSILIMGGRDMVTKRRLNTTSILNLNDGSNAALFRPGPDMKDVPSSALLLLCLVREVGSEGA